MNTAEYRSRVSEVRRAIAGMEQDVGVPHMALLFRSMYNDDYKDNSYERLQYLRLWESLADAGPKHLSCPKKHYQVWWGRCTGQ